MNKFTIIEEIEKALNDNNIECNGAMSIDIPFELKPEECEDIFVYDMSYSTFKRNLIALYNVPTKTIRKPNF